ncbi:MAG: CDP-alcohol phosphatidyltransferase family protein [Caldimicrobium sp.]|nr:CDP-alcohol phosphatidyltransferase family protein [Caldimicrobium sp.]MCX7613706.1 CDP-alcohol phosphatidyltransferase family protein [Caldimicrobium sp.]MDW8093966.1 CDP-alcohol phosphatidyltransferase family protein [Caldimicrobium sp.]MDW8183125.1 CDP-alcohol phosphatidyltransferase family protein [Caldimicrobium sp.]
MSQEATGVEIGTEQKDKGLFKELTPNRITLLRIFLLPLPCALLFLEGHLAKLFSLGLGSLLGFTDYVDGVLARKQKRITTLGSMLDPVADKIFITVVYLTLVYLGYFPFAPVALLLSREILVALLRSWFPEETKVINLARWKTAFQMSLAGLSVLISLVDRDYLRVVEIALWGLVVFSFLSAFPYFYRVRRALLRTKIEPLLLAKSLLSLFYNLGLLLSFPMTGKFFFVIQIGLSFYFFRKGLARTSPLHAQEESLLIMGILSAMIYEVLHRGSLFYSLFFVLVFNLYRDGVRSFKLIWEILRRK